MKVLFWDPLYASPVGGGQVVTSILRRSLERLGVEARVACLAGGGGEECFGLMPKSSIKKILRSVNSLEVLSPLLASQLKALMERERFDYIHIQSPVLAKAVLKALRGLKGEGRPRTIFDMGALEVDYTIWRRYYNPLLYGLLLLFNERYHSLLKQFDVLNACSNYMKWILKKLGFTDERILTINTNVVSREWFEIGHSPRRGKALLFAPGRVEREKGFEVIARALAILVNECGFHDFYLLHTGRGRFKPHLYSLARRRGYADKLLDLGWRPYSTLPQIYSKATLVLVLYQHAGVYSQALAEAMATENAPIASDLGAFKEVVEHARTGLLVNPQHPRKVAHNILGLLEDERKLREMGREARRRAKIFFDPQRAARAFLNYYYGIR